MKLCLYLLPILKPLLHILLVPEILVPSCRARACAVQPSTNSVCFSGFAEVTRDKVNRGARYGVESEIPSIYRLYGPKPYSYVDRTLSITGVLLDMYFYLKWIASTEHVVDRVGVAVGVWLSCKHSEAILKGICTLGI